MNKRLDMAKAKLKSARAELHIAEKTHRQALRRWQKAATAAQQAQERLDDILARTA